MSIMSGMAFDEQGFERFMVNPHKKYSKVRPKIAKGRRQIANDLFNALIKARLSGPEYQITLFVINQTWGFGKDDDNISYSQFTNLTGLTRRACINIVQKLEAQRIVIVNREIVKGCSPLNSYGFNKYYDTWINITGEPLFTALEIKLVNKYSLHMTPKVVNAHTKSGEVQRQKVVNGTSHNNSSSTKENTKEATTKPKRSFFAEQVKQDMKNKQPLKMTKQDIPDIEPF